MAATNQLRFGKAGMKLRIETTGLRKTYGSHEAVRGLDLSVQEGSVCAFLGKNGAGKSSTIKMLLGMVHPTAGSGTVLGHHRLSAIQCLERKIPLDSHCSHACLESRSVIADGSPICNGRPTREGDAVTSSASRCVATIRSVRSRCLLV
jgi:ABC-2 type transport system ATP-binding protein